MLVYFLGLCFLWKLDLLSLWESSKKKVLESVLSFRRQTRLQCHTENGKGGKDLGAILL